MEHRKRYLYIWTIIAFVVFILISLVALVILNQTTKTTPVPFFTSETDVRRVSIADAKAAFDSGSAIFIDVRDHAVYDHAHIPGALSIPVSELTDHLGKLDPSNWIITYCT